MSSFDAAGQAVPEGISNTREVMRGSFPTLRCQSKSTNPGFPFASPKPQAPCTFLPVMPTHFLFSSGSVGMDLCSISNSSSCWMMDFTLTWTPEILRVGPLLFPGPFPAQQQQTFQLKALRQNKKMLEKTQIHSRVLHSSHHPLFTSRAGC